MKSLQWGPDDVAIKDKFGDSIRSCMHGHLAFGTASLTNFPGDCGALVLRNANSIDVATLKLVNKVASFCGFSKIFATVCLNEHQAEKQRLVFRQAGWKLSHKGFSNRNPTKVDLVFVKYIRNCEYKGY